jgi:competence protein ComEC
MHKIFFIIMTSLLAQISFAHQEELIVWNVGQGQWVTDVQDDFCVHYDMGGEINVTSQVLKHCQGKKNFLHLSHWDWDHISFVGSFTQRAFISCLIEKPLGSSSSSKERLLAGVSPCKPNEIPGVFRTLFRGQIRGANTNNASSVVQDKDFDVLIPGDSTSTMEKTWRWQTSLGTHGLILGHHGSRTSTSRALLERLPHLLWAVASAREKRYGHPHAQVKKLLRDRGIVLLRTEDWGNLHFFNAHFNAQSEDPSSVRSSQ